MPHYSYTARNTKGDLITGSAEALSAASLAAQLSSTGILPLEIREKKVTGSTDIGGMFKGLKKEKVTHADIQLFSRHMHTLLKSGVPLLRGLAGLEDSSVNKGFAKIIKEIRESLDTGRDLSTAIAQHPKVFSDFYVSMIRVGEMTGRLDDVFLRLFDHLEFERDMRARIKAAMRYPSFVLIAMAVAMGIINIFVIPAFATVYAGFGATLPLMTRILLGVSNATISYWPLMLLSTFGGFYAFKSYVKTTPGRFKWDRLKLKLPVIGPIIQKATMARFARSFSLTSKSGVPIVHGLSVVAKTVDNDYIGSKLEQMRDGLERGESIIRTAAKADVFTPVVMQMITVGEETGSLDELMEEIAEMYQREVDYEIKTLSAKIEPLLLVLMGGMVLVLALGIFLPMWDLGSVAIAPKA